MRGERVDEAFEVFVVFVAAGSQGDHDGNHKTDGKGDDCGPEVQGHFAGIFLQFHAQPAAFPQGCCAYGGR